MDYEALITRLTTEAASGSSNAAEAGLLLERLEATHAAYAAGPSDDVAQRSFAERYAEWETAVAERYTQYDEAVRSLMVLALAICHRYPDAETDAHGNVIPVELRGQPINETIRGYDTLSPIATQPVGVRVAGDARYVARQILSELNVFGSDQSDYDAVIAAAK